MELMDNGDLKNYLFRHRQSEVNVGSHRHCMTVVLHLLVTAERAHSR